MRTLLASLCGLLLAGAAGAHEFKAGAITVDHPWARPAASGNSAAYFVIENAGEGDRLIGAATDVAATVEMHSTTIDAQGVGRMVPVQAVDVPQGAEAKFAPGGLHVMLIGLKQPLVEGQEFPLTLTFEKAGAVTVEVAVEKTASHGAGGDMQHGHGTTSP
jgi:copper(I)-binding protein